MSVRGFLGFILSVALSFILFSAGINKLFPVDAGVHEYLVNVSQHWPALFPWLGLDGTAIRLLIGTAEALGALVLLLSPCVVSACLGGFVTLYMIAIMIGAIYLHVQTSTDVTAAAVVLGLLIARHLIIPRKSCKC